MKLINSSVEIWEQEPGIEGILKQIERCGRVCYKSEDKITEGSAQKFVEMLINKGHGAMLEHGTVFLLVTISSYQNFDWEYSVGFYIDNPYSEVVEIKNDKWAITTNFRVLVENNKLDDLQYLHEPTEYHEKRITAHFICDRGTSHELVRHRVFSFAQESTRYCNYSNDKFGKEITCIIPSWYEDKENEAGFDTRINIGFTAGCHDAEHYYFWMLDHGATPQQARSVLPNALKTEVCMTGFYTDWIGKEIILSSGIKIKRGFFPLRTDNSAHPDMQPLAKQLKEKFKQYENT